MRHANRGKDDGNNILDESSDSNDDEGDPSWWDEELVLMAFDLGYDEGGSGDTLIVSAQLAIYEQAKKLKRKWKSRLGNVEYFHSVDFDNRSQGVFSDAGLGMNERHELLRDLCKILHDHAMGSITAWVSVKEYNRITTPQFRSGAGTAYGFLIDMVLLMAHSIIDDRGLKTQVNILIEDGHRNINQVTNIIATLRKIPVEILPIPIHIVSAGVGSKEDHPILQAADMSAYSRWQQLTRGDPTIWRALYKPDARYMNVPIPCDEHLIRAFMTPDEGVATINEFLARTKREEKNERRRVSEVRSNDAETNTSAARGNKEEVGGGEKSKEAES